MSTTTEKSYFLGVFDDGGEDNFLQNTGSMTPGHRVKDQQRHRTMWKHWQFMITVFITG